MERKGWLFSRLLTCAAVIAAVSSCTGTMKEEKAEDIRREVMLRISAPALQTRGGDAYEDRISTLDLLIFEDGMPDYRTYRKTEGASDMEVTISLVSGRNYSIYAFVNFKDRIEAESITEVQEAMVQLQNPSNEGLGIPMYGFLEDITVSEEKEISMQLTRMMAKVSIRMDRSRLSRDVELQVRRISACNCPRNASVFTDSRARSRFDCFDTRYGWTGDECSPLNTVTTGGFSEEVSLFLLENMQGEFPHEIGEDEEKVLDEEGLLSQICSYIELEMEYCSPRHFINGQNLIYRFYLGEGLKDLNVERNCHYHIDIVPEDDGLSGGGWRVDKSGIGTYAQEIILSADTLEMTYRGEEHQLEATVVPDGTTFREVSWKSSDPSVADISPDGKVTAHDEGTCLITCSATDGSPATSTCGINVRYAPPSFTMYPGDYIEGNVGDDIHIWCEIFPPNAPFDPGHEELDYDKSRGIYDYTIDEDGKGVTLHLKKPGTGIIYMTAGEPVNQSGMAIVVVRSYEGNAQYAIPPTHPAFQECLRRPDVLRHLPLQVRDRSPSQPHG